MIIDDSEEGLRKGVEDFIDLLYKEKGKAGVKEFAVELILCEGFEATTMIKRFITAHHQKNKQD